MNLQVNSLNAEHPITPPPELVQCFLRSNPDTPDGMTYEQFIATRFARWGADMELEACCEWLDNEIGAVDPDDLRAERRPKPPSLKEQALDAWDRLRNEAWCQEIDADLDFVRRALEALPD